MLNLRESQFEKCTVPLIRIHDIDLLVFAKAENFSPCKWKMIENKRSLLVRHC